MASSDTGTMAEMSSEKFAFLMVKTCKQPDMQQILKNIIIGDEKLQPTSYQPRYTIRCSLLIQKFKRKNMKFRALDYRRLEI